MSTTLYHGSELCEVDAEGNVALPAFVADALGGDAGPELLVGRHETDACLIGYGRDHLDDLRTRAERLRLADEARGEDARNHYRRMRNSFGMVEKMPRARAKLRIPPVMRHIGRIDRLALFVGAGDSFEIWNPELAMASEDPQFRDLASYRMQARSGRQSNRKGH